VVLWATSGGSPLWRVDANWSLDAVSSFEAVGPLGVDLLSDRFGSARAKSPTVAPRMTTGCSPDGSLHSSRTSRPRCVERCRSSGSSMSCQATVLDTPRTSLTVSPSVLATSLGFFQPRGRRSTSAPTTTRRARPAKDTPAQRSVRGLRLKTAPAMMIDVVTRRASWWLTVFEMSLPSRMRGSGPAGRRRPIGRDALAFAEVGHNFPMRLGVVGMGHVPILRAAGAANPSCGASQSGVAGFASESPSCGGSEAPQGGSDQPQVGYSIPRDRGFA
jgi:hypothetical protein